ncbi:1-deoxy-D-xylulose-5-phosphate synthase [Streptomyces boncukensis]|uniref:1-deoxy-D-xylulose-5-phosphate synthase n=1 Tax=Streptomyces boncukensis TaxID=2711219 RepID=A0A6G4WUR6_9ACTN|nr:1-deoxy-D-xylulose-5-phosphate synthase [Streptomyces boncukensis]NGO68743.1 1-deoxy-D-xylulose-5-phosphate synthase [Streptomyces boncukensis]
MATTLPDTSLSLLERVADPGVLRTLPADRLPHLADEIRRFLVAKVCARGGHLGPNLGMVELTLALHRVFESPRDALVFDIGHQAYVHKLLTGRQKGFDTLRQPGGLSGYPSRAESVHDLVENSHASTALSYADGLAEARALAGESDRSVVAVIGDGALGGGMAFEALNNLGAAPERPVIVVVNDNGRSYAPTTGALAKHLSVLKYGGGAEACRNVFTDLGFTYFGPVDGHNTREVESVLCRARAMKRPVVVHVMTVKGKGHRPSETDPSDCLHAVGAIAPDTGRPVAKASGPSWTSEFGHALAEAAAAHPKVVAVTAGMLLPTGLGPMKERFPERVFDVGIAEQHAVTSAAGLATGGPHPLVAIYATFLNRAFDQVVMDVALHRLPVTFVLDRAGITGPDGPSHHGMWDLGLLSMVPGLRLAAPRDTTRLRLLLDEAVAWSEGPTVLRIPKSSAGTPIEAVASMDGVDVLYRGKGRPLDVLLVPVGPLAQPALEAAHVLQTEHGIGCTVADPRWVLPVNPALESLAARHRLVVSVEDGVVTGGVGTALAQWCQDRGVTTPVHALGLPRAFLAHGSRPELLTQAGLDAPGLVRAVLNATAHRDAGPAVPLPAQGSAR